MDTNVMLAASVASTYDFSDVKTVVDVGGGNGTLLVEILRQHPHVSGLVLELNHVAAHADAVLDAVDVGDRCEVMIGDFFQTVPAGADRYIVANVLPDWDDGEAVRILANCREAMAETGRVLIVERLFSGGRERTSAEYGELLAAAGFAMTAVQPVAFPYGIIEGVPV